MHLDLHTRCTSSVSCSAVCIHAIHLWMENRKTLIIGEESYAYTDYRARLLLGTSSQWGRHIVLLEDQSVNCINFMLNHEATHPVA